VNLPFSQVFVVVYGVRYWEVRQSEAIGIVVSGSRHYVTPGNNSLISYVSNYSIYSHLARLQLPFSR
jgi:hypothetical protein